MHRLVVICAVLWQRQCSVCMLLLDVLSVAFCNVYVVLIDVRWSLGHGLRWLLALHNYRIHFETRGSRSERAAPTK